MAVVPAGAAADPGDPDLRLAAAQADVDLSRIPALRDLLPLLPTSALRALGVEATEVGYGGGDLQNPPLAPTDTYVNGTETWTGAHEVVGSLRVNGHLTLDGAALTLLLRGPTDTLSVAPGGTLVVRNSTVSGDMDARHSRVVAQGNLTVDRSTFAHVALSVTVASGRSARIANSTFTQTPTAVDVHSSAVEVRNNRFYEVGTGLLVSAPLGCGGCRIAPVVTGNLFEMATVGVEFGRDADTDFHHNYLGTNRLSVSCTDEAAATIRRNVFDLSVFGAYAGESPLPGKTDGSACALQSNFYESRGGDAERRNLGINDVDDPSPVYPPAAPYSFEEMGFPADLRPGFAPLVVSATTIWTSATVPPIGQPVIVTGQGVTLTVRGATLDLGGGFLGSRQNGTLRLEADGATRTRVEDGSVLLAHQGLSQDAILGAVFATASTKPAVTVYETAARIEDTEFRNQTVAISAEAALQNAGRNQVTIKRTLFQDDGVAITGFMAGTVDDSKFLRNGVAILGALTAPVVRTSEFVGNTVAYFGVLAPVASFADSSVTASQLAFVGAYAGVAINRSSVEYNAVGFTLLGSSVTGGDNNVFHNVVASFTADDLPSPVGVGIQPSTVTLAGHCGKDDAFYTTGTSQVTLTPPLTACPHAEPFPLRFTPRVAGEGGQPGTLPLPGGTIAGPYIAPTGRKLVATGVTVEGKCDRARADCVAPGGFVVGAKPGGGVEIADSVARNVTLAMAGNPNKLVRTLCQGCALFAMDESAGGARLDLTWSRFVGSNIQVERQDNRTTRVERALFEDTSYALRTLAPHAFDRVVSMNGSKISRADLGTLPGAPENLHSDLSVRRSNFARNAEAVRDSDDSTPEQPATAIDARDNWWGADCGPRTATCHGDPVTASTGANAAPPPVTSPFATAPLEIQPDASFTFSPSSPTTQTPVTFTGFATTFAGLGLSYAWDFGEGNASDARVVTRTFPVPGTYSVSFTATDALGGARTVTRTVSVANVPPVADFAASTLAPVEGSVVTFTDASTDADGAVVNWTWDFGDGTPKSYERHPTHVYADGGTRVAKLTARDDLGATATVQRTLSVAHVAPVADFTVSGTTENDTFVFTDASAHPNAPTDSVVTRSWRCDDGATGSGATWTRTFPDGRAYSCRLTVADNDGVTHFRDRAVEVAHVPPVAAFTWTLAPEGQTSTFTDASTHPKVNDTPPAGWTWNWTLGSPSATATTRNATRVFPDGGDYDVTLVVRDNDGQT
ncbi:MAG TPA: PKD domain-containing protein, partial [Candidatus Thermoplasmatota archaeon]|nr:PKD domain-containing protein [Candidatus Thermoplasmatota archaeon]